MKIRIEYLYDSATYKPCAALAYDEQGDLIMAHTGKDFETAEKDLMVLLNDWYKGKSEEIKIPEKIEIPEPKIITIEPEAH